MTEIEQRLRDEAATYAEHQTERALLTSAADTIHSLTEERDRQFHLLANDARTMIEYIQDNDHLAARLARYEEVVKAARALADHAWRLKAYPQGLAGQDKLVGVAQQDIFDLRVLAAKMLNAIDFAALDTEDK